MDDIIKIVESLEKSGQIVDGATETVKHGKQQQKQEGIFVWAMMAIKTALLITPMTSSLI